MASRRLATAYLACGLGALALAPYLGWTGVFCLWFAAAHFGLVYAYLRRNARVLGKREDGSLSWVAVLVFLPYLLLVWGFFHLKRIVLRRHPCWHEVAPRLYLGRRPLPGELPDDAQVVIDMTCEFPKSRQLTTTSLYRTLPTLNRLVPETGDFAAALAQLAELDAPIFVHCGAGHGRAATLTAALMILRGIAGDVLDAEEQMRRIRPGVRLHPIQRELVKAQTQVNPKKSRLSERIA